jgi:hypothetical protein
VRSVGAVSTQLCLKYPTPLSKIGRPGGPFDRPTYSTIGNAVLLGSWSNGHLPVFHYQVAA